MVGVNSGQAGEIVHMAVFEVSYNNVILAFGSSTGNIYVWKGDVARDKINRLKLQIPYQATDPRPPGGKPHSEVRQLIRKYIGCSEYMCVLYFVE